MTREEAIKILKSMSDISTQGEAIDMAIEALSANCTTEKPNDAVEQKNDVVVEPTDLISRADAIEAIESRQTEQWIDADVDYNNGLESAVAEIKALPSADRQSGEWIRSVVDFTDGSHAYHYHCNNCNEEVFVESNYCPNCGAKMGVNK